MADLVSPRSVRRVVAPGATIVQEFVLTVPPSSGSVTATVAGDGMVTIRELVGTRLGEREELPQDVLDQLPPFLREQAARDGFRPTIEYGRVGAGVPLTMGGGDTVLGRIECRAPATQAPGTTVATVHVAGYGTPVELPITVSVGEVRIEPLGGGPIIARRGQTVPLLVVVTFPSGMPAADLRFELDGQHSRISPTIVGVPAGGGAVAHLSLVTDLDAPIGPLTEQLNWMHVTGYDGPATRLPPCSTSSSLSQPG